MGFRHGQYLNYVGDHAFGGGWNGGTEPWQREFDREDRPLGELYVTMLRRLGVEIAEFAGCSAGIEEV